MKSRSYLHQAALKCLVAVCFLVAGPSASQAQTDSTSSKVGIFAGGGASATFSKLYDRARFGYHGTFGLTVRLASGTTQSFELVPITTAGFFHNDGHIGGDFIIMTGGAELRLVAGSNQSVHYFVGVGSGIGRVRERNYRSRETGRMVDGYIEWGPYFSPGVGFDFPVSRRMRLFSQVHLMNIFGTRIANYQFLQMIIGLRL